MSRKLLALLALAAIGAIVAYRLAGWQFNWSLFFSQLWNLQPWWLLASIATTILTYVLRAYRWQVLLAPIKPIRTESLLSTTLVGFSAIFILGRAGELVRPMWLARREQIPLTASVATIIVERFLDSIMLIAVFAWALLTVEVPPSAGPSLTLMKNAAWWIVGASVAAMVVFFGFRSNLHRILQYVPFARIRKLTESFAQGLNFLQSGRSLALSIIHSVLLWIVIALNFWFTLLALRIGFSPEAATLVMVGSAIGSIVQLPGVGGGFQAGFVFCMVTFFKMPAEGAVAASVDAWVFSIAPTILATIVYMIIQGVNLRDLKSMIKGPQSETI